MSQAQDNDIRYVCVSDMHFGETDSLLTCLDTQQYVCHPSRVSPVVTHLVTALQDLIDQNQGPTKPTLILNGDILDLAFSSMGHALQQFENFLELTIKPGAELFDRIVYLPGNHDHHIWEIARETLYVTNQLREHWHENLPDPAHVTSLDGSDAVPSYLLNQLVRHVRGLSPEQPTDYNLSIVYPNLALLHDREDRAVFFHHGHYCEGIYWFISTLRHWLFPDREKPHTVEQLEAENFAWIDFVWSLLGRSGQAGAEVETLYKKLQYEQHADAFIGEIAQRIAKVTNIPLVPGNWLEADVLQRIFKHIAQVTMTERHRDDRYISDEIATDLRKYLFGPVYQQLQDTFGRIPADLTFVFGHTHKPFEEGIENLPQSSRFTLYNTGGWTVDSAQPSPSYGAAIALVSTQLRTAMLRIFNFGAELNKGVRVEQILDADSTAASFADSVSTRLGITAQGEIATRPAWLKLRDQITEEALRRQKHLAQRFLSGH